MNTADRGLRGSGADADSVSRRYLQARRRRVSEEDDLRRLIHPDCIYVETTEDGPIVARGRDATLTILSQRLSVLEDPSQLSIVKHVEVSEDRFEGHWRRPSVDGGVITGRDVMTVVDGLIVRIQVETLSAFH